MKLPNPEHAVVDIRKIRDYCLNPHHPRGRHKARVFASALGLKIDEARYLRSSLLKAAQDSIAIRTEEDEYGQRFVVDFQMIGPKGDVIVRSSWIVRRKENFARFLSCYVL
jgi:hypothetical protein